MHRLALAIPALALACSSPAEPIGFDLDVDPELIADRKDDNTACIPYPGGSLSGDDLLVLVNKQTEQQLAENWGPSDLVAIPDAHMMPGRSGQLRLGAYLAFEELLAAAQSEDGLDLVARSAYRSFVTQCWTFDFKVQQHGLAHAKKFSAEPGRSQHQLGTTVDITAATLGFGLNQSMGDTAEGQWLESHAHRFGFALSYPDGFEQQTGYGYEPWHYRYIGVDAADEQFDSGEILEVYLQRCANGDPALACPLEDMPSPPINDGWIGGTCSSDAECADLGSAATCLTEADGYPGGQCSRPCISTCPDRPGPNAVSACLATDAGDLCHSRCDFDLFEATGCRDGYQCQSAPRPQGDSAMACVPAP